MDTTDDILAWLTGLWTDDERAAIDAATEQGRTGEVITDDQLADIHDQQEEQ